MGEQKNHSNGVKSPQLEQYGILLSYLQYENTTFWTRAGFFLVAHTALFGFVVQILPPFDRCLASWERVAISVIVGITGLLLAKIWWKALRKGEEWIDRWHTCLLELEPLAFGDMQVLRGAVTPGLTRDPKRHGARAVADWVVYLFSVLWGLVFVYGIGIGLLKLSII
jgi:hypothetical protein